VSGASGNAGYRPRDRVSQIYKVETRCYNQPLDDWLRSAMRFALFSPALGTLREREREREREKRRRKMYYYAGDVKYKEREQMVSKRKREIKE